jgi:adenylate kinase family enzyme
MPLRRIHITGAAGAGVTTLGRALARRLGVSHYDVDDFYWLPSDPPYRQKRAVPERLRLLGDALGRTPDAWVLSGSLDGWGDPLVPLFDLVVFLLVPKEVRLDRLRARERQRYGDDALAPGGGLHEEYVAFLEWARAYDEGTREGRNRARHEAWLARLSCPAIRFEGVLSVEDMLGRILGRETSANPAEN